ncbi:MAG: nucleotidyltransferase domain-containing protein [Patescibacteria group bacterium]|nr:nucleotidyltransferase domain-containing protein [Patescibacteria group bacterium]
MLKQEKYQKEIEKIIKQIREKYKPEKIILYGSFANGDPTKDSDVDLFIIKRTKKERTKRHLEIDRMFLDRVVPLDILVYTPQEIKKRLILGDFFIKNIINHGKVLYAEK